MTVNIMDKEISLELDSEYGSAMPTMVSEGQKREPDYPAFRYEGIKELDLPDEGEMTVKFRKVSETSSVDKKGVHHYACTIEVQAICDVEGEEEPDEMYDDKAKGTEDALDAIKSLMEKHMAEESE